MGTQSTQTVVASSARTANGTGSAFRIGDSNRVSIMAIVTAASGTTPSLVLSLEWSHNGTTWAAGQPVAAMDAIVATGNQIRSFDVLGEFYRVVWAITGTTPSFTFSVQGYGI